MTYKVRKVLPKYPKKFASIILKLVQNFTPKKEKQLTNYWVPVLRKSSKKKMKNVNCPRIKMKVIQSLSVKLHV